MAKKMDINEFMKDTKPKGGDIESLDLKELGKAIVWLHPSGIFKRDAHYFPVYATVLEDKKPVQKVYMAMIIHEDVKSCLICQLRKALRDNEDIDNDEIILRVAAGTDEEVEYNKGEIIGAEGYGWKKNIQYKTEYLFGVINNAKPEKVLKLTAPKSLGKSITKVIEDQIEEEGEENGNPFKKPYAFKLVYDKNAAQAGDMYDATWNKAEISDEVQELLDSEGLDLSVLTEVTSEAKVAYIIKESLIYDAEKLGLDLSAADEFDAKELDRLGNQNDSEKPAEKKKEVKKEVKKPAEKEVKKPVEKAPEKAPEKSGTVKKVAKTVKAPEKPQCECPSCGKMIDEDAMKCPHCEAEFEEATTIECPSCGKDIPADSTTCPECNEDVNPF